MEVQLIFPDGSVASQAMLTVWADKDPVNDCSSSSVRQPGELVCGPYYGGESFLGSPALAEFGLVLSFGGGKPVYSVS